MIPGREGWVLFQEKVRGSSAWVSEYTTLFMCR